MHLISLHVLLTITTCSLILAKTLSPISVAPSQNWDGDDGPWSSFTLQVGNPAQNVRVFVSTSSPDTWVVRSYGCLSDDDGCLEDRGRPFNPNTSTTWDQTGFYNLNVIQNEASSVRGQFGNDTVGLGVQGSGGPILKNQIVATYTDPSLYLGLFGLNPASTNFSATDQGRPSYMTSLKKNNLIPSLSFGYTAGSQYRLKQVFGSLTLGGFDSSRFIPNPLTIGFTGDDPTKALQASVQKIYAIEPNGTTSDLLANPITAQVDSTIAMIWLPTTVCQAFEKAFGLIWDNNTQLYLVNDDLHSALLERNASVQFTVSNQTRGGQTTDVILPYKSFDLLAKPPYNGINQTSRYFPLKRSTNDSQITLGRTFLQEAYLIVDYERRNFSISQCKFTNIAKQSLVPIRSLTASDPANSLSTAAKVGIAVAIVVLILLVATSLTYFLLRRRQRRKRLAALPSQPGTNPAEETIRKGFAKGELGAGPDNTRHEIEGSDGNALKPYGGATPSWVTEKLRLASLNSRAEIDSAEASPRAELSSPTSRAACGAGREDFFSARGVHEMYDPSSIQPIELPGDRRLGGEMEGSTPTSSSSSSLRPSPGTLILSPDTTLSRLRFGKPSPLDHLDGSRSGHFTAWRRSKASSSSSLGGRPSGPSSPGRSRTGRGLASLASSSGQLDGSGLVSPITQGEISSPPFRQGGQSETGLFSPVSPANEQDGYGNGRFRGFGSLR